MRINGSCHCGAISFVAEVDPDRVLVCHCKDCQVLSGAPCRAIVTTPIEQFTLTGEPSRYVKVADSGNRRAQMFCPTCGTHLFAAAAEDPSWVSVRLGCVEQRNQLPPAFQIWQHSAMTWLAELPTLPGSAQQQAFSAPAK